MPEVKVSHPMIMIELTNVPSAQAIKLRGFLGEFLKARELDATVGYSEPDRAIRVMIKSMDQPISDYIRLINDTITTWIDAPEIISTSTKTGRRIRWS